VTFQSSLQHRRASIPAPATESCAPRRRGRAGAVVAVVLGISWALGAACTLTSDEFEPPLVAGDPLAPAPDEPAPEPDASACEVGVECCSAVPCPAEDACVDGTCQTLDTGNGTPDAGTPSCVGDDCPGDMPPVPLAPSCDDGVQNGDETGPDCGGSCTGGCGVDDGCDSDGDCASGLICSTQVSRCAAVSCTDDSRNGAETDTDCGGGECPACADGDACNVGSDCQSRVCGSDGTCAAPSCNDDQRNGLETGTDCGGPCPQNCATGGGCERNNDCQSGVCGTLGCGGGDARCCQAPSCNDNVRNGTEVDTDCGNAACGPCSLGDTCTASAQCNTGLCQGGVCVNPPRCDDNVQNGTESDTDCGGTCARCPDLSDCNQDADCSNNNCDPAGTCISCGDNVRNGTETGVDCGGADPFCRRCNPGEACASNTDCLNQFCLAGVCT